MYMATSDLEGLQNAIIEAGESAITFNEETGEMGISPTEMRRMRAMAEQLGMGYEEYVNSVKMAKQETLAMSQMNLGAFAGSEDAEQLQQFAASMAQFKDGKYQIELEPGKFTALEDLQDTQVKLLRESMKGDEERAKEMDAASEKEIMFRSMTALEAIQAQATKGQLGFEMELGAQGQQLAESTIKLLQTPLVDVFQDSLKAGAVTIREVLKEVVVPGAGNEASVDAAFGEVRTGLEAQFQTTFGAKWEQYLNSALQFFSSTDPANVSPPVNVEDYFTQGVTDISNSAGRVRTQPTDIIAAFDSTKINTALPAGAIGATDMENFGRQIRGQGGQSPGGTVKVDVNLGGTATLNAAGLNMNIDAKQLLDQNLVLMWLKDKLEETALDGKPGYKSMQKGGGVLMT